MADQGDEAPNTGSSARGVLATVMPPVVLLVAQPPPALASVAIHLQVPAQMMLGMLQQLQLLQQQQAPALLRAWQGTAAVVPALAAAVAAAAACAVAFRLSRSCVGLSENSGAKRENLASVSPMPQRARHLR